MATETVMFLAGNSTFGILYINNNQETILYYHGYNPILEG